MTDINEQVNEKGKIPILPASMGLNALRQSAYKSIPYAIAELIDNSLQANAEHINIIARSQKGQSKGIQKIEKIFEIAVFDNADGMDLDTLSISLSLGQGTNLENRDENSLGKFGYGLKGSSLFVGKEVEVFSWQNNGSVYSVKLDLDEIERTQTQYLDSPSIKKIPKEYIDIIKDKKGDSGTLVVWRNLDKIKITKAETFYRHLSNDASRIFRHFLDDDDTHGVKKDIQVTLVDRNNKIESKILESNDPLFLLRPNNLPGEYKNQETNIVFGKKISEMFEYEHGKFTNVEFNFTIAKPEIQAATGSSEIGKVYRNNNGISFVRACREIMLHTEYLEPDPRERWWSCEVRFNHEADNIFGVSKDKQRVENIKGKLDAESLEELMFNIKEAEDINEKDDYYFECKALVKIDEIIMTELGKLRTLIKKRGTGKRTVKEGEKPGGDVPDEIEPGLPPIDPGHPTISETENEGKVYEQKVKEVMEQYLKTHPDASKEEAKLYAEEFWKLRLNFSIDEFSGSMFLDRKSLGNAAYAIINSSHPFFDKFYDRIMSGDDELAKKSLKLVLMSFIRTEDSMARSLIPSDINEGLRIFSEIREEWGKQVRTLINYIDD